MKKITVLIVALSLSCIASAQISITGIVTNDSIPLESASVIIKNSTKGIATNSKGKFKLEAKKGDTLSISYLGYGTKEILIENKKHLNVKLTEGGKLDEVVVNAFLHGFKTSCETVCYVERGCGVNVETPYKYESLYLKVLPKLFPNPSSNGIFQLKLTEDYDEVQISIVNISGRIIQNTTHQKFGENVNLDLSQFSTGIYIVNIIADGKRLESIKAIRN